MASIVILSIAIIPMVAMFDSGLKAASTSGNHDTARAFGNKKLEQARSLSYAQARDNFPRAGDGTPTAGTPATITNSAPLDQVPDGFSYTVRKRYLAMTPGASPDRTNLAPAAAASGETKLIEVTVTVSWGSGKSYTTTGVVTADIP